MSTHHVHVPLLVNSWYALLVRAGAIIMLYLLVSMCWGQVGRLRCASWYVCVVVAGCSDNVADLGAYVLVLAAIIMLKPAGRVCHQHAFVQY
jgi:hypothetical protein